MEKRIRKFNGGAGAILCNGCNVIIWEGFEGNAFQEARLRRLWPNCKPLISKEAWESEEPLYCEKCNEEAKRRAANYMSLP
jgi:hypothetical protein